MRLTDIELERSEVQQVHAALTWYKTALATKHGDEKAKAIIATLETIFAMLYLSMKSTDYLACSIRENYWLQNEIQNDTDDSSSGTGGPPTDS